MKIAKLDVYPVKIPLFAPFTTALHSVEEKICVIVRLEDELGNVGWGEAAPEQEITHDDYKDALELIEFALRKEIIGAAASDHKEFHQLLDSLSAHIVASSTGVAAVDIALHDLYCKNKKMPLYEYFNGSNMPLRTSISIGITDMDNLLKTIQRIVDSNGRIIKLKIGLGIEEDIKMIKRVRDTFGDRITLRLDANQAYSPDDAKKLFCELEQFDIEFIEQPVQADDLEGLKYIHDECKIPVMADEAVSSFDDLVKIVVSDICDRVNIKLMKSGGLHSSSKMMGYCGKNKIDCMIGCMIETPIGISAGVHLGLSGGAVKWTDLDGHLFLSGTEGILSGLATNGDYNNVSDASGLGIDVNEDLLRNFII
jgi:o-succinylbenzoate synthase